MDASHFPTTARATAPDMAPLGPFGRVSDVPSGRVSDAPGFGMNPNAPGFAFRAAFEAFLPEGRPGSGPFVPSGVSTDRPDIATTPGSATDSPTDSPTDRARWSFSDAAPGFGGGIPPGSAFAESLSDRTVAAPGGVPGSDRSDGTPGSDGLPTGSDEVVEVFGTGIAWVPEEPKLPTTAEGIAAAQSPGAPNGPMPQAARGTPPPGSAFGNAANPLTAPGNLPEAGLAARAEANGAPGRVSSAAPPTGRAPASSPDAPVTAERPKDARQNRDILPTPGTARDDPGAIADAKVRTGQQDADRPGSGRALTANAAPGLSRTGAEAPPGDPARTSPPTASAGGSSTDRGMPDRDLIAPGSVSRGDAPLPLVMAATADPRDPRLAGMPATPRQDGRTQPDAVALNAKATVPRIADKTVGGDGIARTGPHLSHPARLAHHDVTSVSGAEPTANSQRATAAPRMDIPGTPVAAAAASGAALAPMPPNQTAAAAPSAGPDPQPQTTQEGRSGREAGADRFRPPGLAVAPHGAGGLVGPPGFQPARPAGVAPPGIGATAQTGPAAPGKEMPSVAPSDDAGPVAGPGTSASPSPGPGGTSGGLGALAQGAAHQIAASLPKPLTDMGGGTIEVALDPPELGRVRLSITDTGGVMTLSIAAERPETAELMRRHIDLLSQEFQRAGLDAPQVRVGTGQGGDGGGQGERPAQDPRGAGAATEPNPVLPAARKPDPGRALDLRI